MKIKSFVGFVVVAMIASMANAASVDWTTGALSFGETALKKSTDVTGYLVYLSSGSLASTYTIDDSFSAASVGTVVASDTDGANKGALLTGSLSVTTLGYGNGGWTAVPEPSTAALALAGLALLLKRRKA